MEKSKDDKKEQSNSFSASLKSAFTTSIALLFLVAISEGCIFGFLLKIFTKTDKGIAIISLCVIPNIIVAILLFVAFTANIKKSSGNLTNVIHSISSGDLSINLDLKEHKALGKIAEHMNSITSEMRKIVQGSYNLIKSDEQHSKRFTAGN